MIKKAILFFICILMLPAVMWADEKQASFPPGTPQKKFWIGEKLVYGIYYLGMPIGQSEAEIRDIVEVKGRKAYHIVTRVRSYPVIDFFYKVRDEHQSYIDVETLASLRYEKDIREGRHREKETIDFDPVKNRAVYTDGDGKVTHEMEIPGNVQDAMSCGYWSRTLEISSNGSIFIPVNAEKKNWNLEVKFFAESSMEIGGVGIFQAMESEPLMEFQGIFVRRGKIRGWISLDERRIPLKMQVKIPVIGFVTAVLKKYQPGKERA